MCCGHVVAYGRRKYDGETDADDGVARKEETGKAKNEDYG